MYNFFDTIHEPVSKKYFGEDFGFVKNGLKLVVNVILQEQWQVLVALIKQVVLVLD
jgi:hypothetical protein